MLDKGDTPDKADEQDRIISRLMVISWEEEMAMKKVKLITIDAAAYLVARGRDAVTKAMQRDRIKTKFTLQLGETTRITVLSFDEVVDLWKNEGVTSWFSQRFKDVSSQSIGVTTPEAEYRVFVGEMDVYTPEILQQRVDDIKKEFKRVSNGQ